MTLTDGPDDPVPQVIEKIRRANLQTPRSFDLYHLQNLDKYDIVDVLSIVADETLVFWIPPELIPRSASDWNQHEIDLLKIKVKDLSDLPAFLSKFGTEGLPNTTVRASNLIELLQPLSYDYLNRYKVIDTEDVTNLRSEAADSNLLTHPLSKALYLLNKYVEHESIVDAYVMLLFFYTGYFENLLFVFPQLCLTLSYGLTGSEVKSAIGDFTILDIMSFFRVSIVEDKSTLKDVDSFPQLVAEMIAMHKKTLKLLSK